MHVVQEIHVRENKWFIASISTAVGRWQHSSFALRKDKRQGNLSIAVNTNEYTSNQDCVFLYKPTILWLPTDCKESAPKLSYIASRLPSSYAVNIQVRNLSIGMYILFQ